MVEDKAGNKVTLITGRPLKGSGFHVCEGCFYHNNPQGICDDLIGEDMDCRATGIYVEVK